MSDKRDIVFVSTIHRMSERLLPVFEALSSDFNVHNVRIGQASQNTSYSAKERFDNTSSMFVSCVSGQPVTTAVGARAARMRSKGEYDQFLRDMISRDVCCVIYDDCRNIVDERSLGDKINKSVPHIANIHGNIDYGTTKRLLSRSKNKFSHMFVFGDNDVSKMRSTCGNIQLVTGGIPANDSLAGVSVTKKFVTVIVNFIPTKGAVGSNEVGDVMTFDSRAIERLKLNSVCDALGVKLALKLKHRLGSSVLNDVKCMRKLVGEEPEIFVNEDENAILQQSAAVISYGSTMAFKPIQMNIPTVIIKELGLIGNFASYEHTISIRDDVRAHIMKQHDRVVCDSVFLDSTIAGGSTFTSTSCYVNNLLRIIDENKKR